MQERDTHTYIQTDRQTDRQTETDKDREKSDKEMRVYHFSKLCRYIIHQQYDQFSYNVLA